VDAKLLVGVTRPYFVRAGAAALVALAGLVIANSFGKPSRAALIDKLTDGDVSVADLVALSGVVVFVVAGLLAVRALTRAARTAMEQELGDTRGAPLALLVSVVGNVILLLATLHVVGVDLTGLLLGGAITGVVVGIAAQQTLANAFAGMVLLIVRPFVVGDDIVLRSSALGGEYKGRVTDMGLFYVDLVTHRGPVKLPNAGVLAGAIGPGARGADDETEEVSGPEKEAAPPAEGGAPR
jgi:small-conductance mechanosensitive channel